MSSRVGAGWKTGRAEGSPYLAAHSEGPIPFILVVADSPENRDMSLAPSVWLPSDEACALGSLHNAVGPLPAESPYIGDLT